MTDFGGTALVCGGHCPAEVLFPAPGHEAVPYGGGISGKAKGIGRCCKSKGRPGRSRVWPVRKGDSRWCEGLRKHPGRRRTGRNILGRENPVRHEWDYGGGQFPVRWGWSGRRCFQGFREGIQKCIRKRKFCCPG